MVGQGYLFSPAGLLTFYQDGIDGGSLALAFVNRFRSHQLAKAGLKIKLEAMVRLLVAGLLLGLLSSSGCIQEQWRGFVYPTRAMIDYQVLGEFDSLEECRDHTVAWLEDRNLLGVGDYECGLNCELSDSGIIYVCEETTR